jgi:hypothetical protein
MPELDVLIATYHWLHEQGWTIENLSPAVGQGLLPKRDQEEMIKQDLAAARIPFEAATLFRSRGPDIVARCDLGIWKFECKGLRIVRDQTRRNHFDRAVASVVSYYDSPQTRLGLALANDYLWESNLGDRLPTALRTDLGLWVILVTPEHGVYPYEPSEPLPYPGAAD